jgi:hypothetical protein
MKRQIIVFLALASFLWPAPATRSQAPARRADALDSWLPARAEVSYRALSARFNATRAMEVVTFMDRFWRIAVNPGFRASLEHLKAGLVQGGFREGAAAAPPPAAVWVEEYPNSGNGWEPVRAEMTIVEAGGGPVPEPCSTGDRSVSLGINSFSTPAGRNGAARLCQAGTDAALRGDRRERRRARRTPGCAASGSRPCGRVARSE